VKKLEAIVERGDDHKLLLGTYVFLVLRAVLGIIGLFLESTSLLSDSENKK
jgi:hypothetical protein